ncbi:unnamed protein product [Commensalibacter communis]|nr:unnamed protein product [Commensalibacter communis]
MDSKQGTCTRWNVTRNNPKIEPVVKTEQYRSVEDAISDYQKITYLLRIIFINSLNIDIYEQNIII